MEAFETLNETLKTLSLTQAEAFFLGFISSALLIATYSFVYAIWVRVVDAVFNGFAWLCKKGFALVKRKFGKEK